MANEARRKGLNSIARPTLGNAAPMQAVRDFLEVIVNPKGTVTKMMKSFGVNSSDFFGFNGRPTAMILRNGRAFVAEYLSNGNVRFGDTQKSFTIPKIIPYRNQIRQPVRLARR